MIGKTEWVFPDAELPPLGNDREVYGHESLIILNLGSIDAQVEIILYWTDRPPTALPQITVASGRVLGIRITEKDGFLNLPIQLGEQYAILLHSSVPVVAQYGRLDVRQENMAFYTTPGYSQ